MTKIRIYLVLFIFVLAGFAMKSCQKDKTPRKLDLNLTYKGIELLPAVNLITGAAFDPLQEVSNNAISLSPRGLVYPGMDTILYDMAGLYWGEKTGGVEDQIGWAQVRGMQVMLKPIVDFQDNITLPSEYNAGSEAEWDIFESAYTKFITHFAKVADSLNCEVLCIGDDFEYFAENRPSYWLTLIDTVREIYSGKITYAADWDDYDQIVFWDLLDYIGVNAYFPLHSEATPSVEEIEDSWLTTVIPDLESFQADQGIPVIFTEFGYRSSDFAANEPWNTDSLGEVNETGQYNVLLGLFNAFDGKTWFEGGFVREWDLENVNAGGSQDDGFTIQNKSGEQLIYLIYSSN